MCGWVWIHHKYISKSKIFHLWYRAVVFVIWVQLTTPRPLRLTYLFQITVHTIIIVDHSNLKLYEHCYKLGFKIIAPFLKWPYSKNGVLFCNFPFCIWKYNYSAFNWRNIPFLQIFIKNAVDLQRRTPPFLDSRNLTLTLTPHHILSFLLNFFFFISTDRKFNLTFVGVYKIKIT